MRVGLTLYTYASQDSLKHVGRSLLGALGGSHQVVFPGHEFAYCADAQQRRMAEEFVANCDVILGLPHPAVLAARQRLGSTVPYAVLLLGALSRGGFDFGRALPQLTTNDVLVVNCTADHALARNLVQNARVRVLPFAYDEYAFWPLAPDERRAVRESLELGADDLVMLYAGRITPEKNVHAVLRVFRTVHDLVPNSRLVVVGPILGNSFAEFGVTPLQFANTIDKIVRKLEFGDGRVLMAGHATSDQMRCLYNAADVMINLTLHHDENFGLTQVEAMACGTPVIGTGWGGLKDTIVDGVSGYKVSTVATKSGVKVNWWEAVNSVLALFRDEGERTRLRESCRRHAVARYAPAMFRSALEDVLEACSGCRSTPAQTLRATDFAEELWRTCKPDPGQRAPFRRGSRANELYQELVVPFTEASGAHVPAEAPFEAGQVLCLATPLAAGEHGTVRIDDPVFPFEVEVPAAYWSTVTRVLTAMREHPAVAVEDLIGTAAPAADPTLLAVRWLVEAGLLLRAAPAPGWVPPRAANRHAGNVLFSVCEVDRSAVDFVVY